MIEDPIKFVVVHEGMRRPVGCARCGEVHELEDSNFHTPWCDCDLDEECDHGLCTDCLYEVLDEAKMAEYQACMSLYVDTDGDSVELVLDTSVPTYSERIKGEGADICLLKSQEDGKVMGVRLPLKRSNLSVWHDGPLMVNEGFRLDGPLRY